jgi:branched-chain amino acid transport system ATP-binding protein
MSATPTQDGRGTLLLRDISYAYDGALAVSGVTMAVRPGEIVALLGSNGAGKSTTAKVIAGALRPQQGSVTFDGKVLSGLPAHKVMRHGLVLVPEGRLVFPEMTVYENLLMGAYKESSRQKVAQRLEYVYGIFPRLRERARQAAGSLSGGEQQMLALARGLMADPRLLILDEPSLGIMPKLVREIFDLIRKIAAGGISVLLIEQNARASLEVADRGYVLEKGKIIVDGPASQLLGDEFIGKAYLGGHRA